MAYFKSKGALTLSLNREFAEGVFRDLLYDPDDEATQSRRKKALAIFQLLEDAAVAVDPKALAAGELDIAPQQLKHWEEAYRVKIAFVCRFKMVLWFI